MPKRFFNKSNNTEKLIFAIQEISNGKIYLFKKKTNLCAFLGISTSTFYEKWGKKEFEHLVVGDYIIRETLLPK